MANTSFTRTYNDFATATTDKYGHKRFEDVISRASPLLSWLMDDDGVTGRGATPGGKGGTSRYLPGTTGNYIEEPLMTELNDTIKFYDGAETFDTSQQNVGTAAFYQPKQLGGTITITGKERRRNKGKEAQINLLQAKTEQALISMKNDLAVAALGTGSGTKAILGISDLCPNDRGAAVALGQITANTSWWLCQRSRSGTTYGDVGDFDANGRVYLTRLFHDCTEGTDAPDLHLVSQDAVEAYWGKLLPYERHESKQALDLGYSHIPMFMGAPVMWDRKHPDQGASSQDWYMLNSNFLFLRYCPEANFDVMGFQRPAHADYITSPVIWEGALTTNNRRMLGIATAITGLT
jgi:hypothetical protein